MGLKIVYVSQSAKTCLKGFLSRLRITKVLSDRPGCAGWSAPLLFANNKIRFFLCQGTCKKKYAFYSNFFIFFVLILELVNDK